MAFDLASAQPVSSGFDLASAQPVTGKRFGSGKSMDALAGGLLAPSGSQEATAATTAAPTILGELGRQAGLTGRSAINALTSIPMLAMDAGVGTRNLVTNLSRGVWPKLNDFNPLPNTGQKSPTDYELPSQTFQRSLTQLGVPEPQTTGDKVASFLTTAALGARLPSPQSSTSIPANFVPAAQSMRGAIAQQGQQRGLVVPPSTVNPTIVNRFLGGLAGKGKVEQGASIQNQPVINQLVARALGQNPDAPLTSGALSAIRGEAAQAGYAPVRAFGQMKTDATFNQAIDDLGAAAQGAERSFPGIKPQGSPFDAIATALKQKTFNSGDGVDAIRYLRSLADDAFGAGNKSLGATYKGAASALEDLIERNLTAAGQGGKDMLAAFRGARQQIAQTYSIQKALVGDTGDVNARALANQLAGGKPITGDLRSIAQFATAFPKAMTVPKESHELISPLDAYGAAIAAGATGSAAPLMLPLTRAGIQRALLSPKGQALAIAQPSQPPQTLGATSGGLLALLGQ